MRAQISSELHSVRRDVPFRSGHPARPAATRRCLTCFPSILRAYIHQGRPGARSSHRALRHTQHARSSLTPGRASKAAAEPGPVCRKMAAARPPLQPPHRAPSPALPRAPVTCGSGPGWAPAVLEAAPPPRSSGSLVRTSLMRPQSRAEHASLPRAAVA